ncbi:DUF2147 domain-containing protein [Mesorhizobium sp. NPDC059054]|uniref:DUF2147 domain-containing protein n=1 Tax=Mesorhizobium sp. NPDC059054 TaxID=3346711 RepID=UPI0036977FEF
MTNPVPHQLVRTLACLAGLLLTASVHAAQGDITTTWLTHDGQGVVEIAPCDGKLCGHIVWLKTPTDDKGAALTDQNNPNSKLRKRPICGLAVLSGLSPDKSGGWDGGKIYDPEEGDTYDAALKLAGSDKLTVTGYLGVKAFGQTFTWKRYALPAAQRCSPAAQQ